MKPTETLMSEHREIEKTLDRVAGLVREKTFDAKAFEESLDFIRAYADKRHHGKEEDRLFPAMVERGMHPDAGPIGCMKQEHELGRALVRRAVAGLEKGDEAEVREALAEFVPLLREHIKKEDMILFPMADRILTPEDQGRLEKEFAAFDAALLSAA